MAAVLRRAVAQCFASSSSSSPATFGLRRFLQEQPAFRPAVPPDRFMPLADRIRDLGVGVAFPRINLDGLVPYADFLRLCCDAAGPDAGPSVARALDESGSVIVLGKTVFLRPDMEKIQRKGAVLKR